MGFIAVRDDGDGCGDIWSCETYAHHFFIFFIILPLLKQNKDLI